MQPIEFEFDVSTISEANCSDHWLKKSKRHQQQQFFTRLAFKKYAENLILPCEIIMPRLGPNFLDEKDNLRMALKWIKDELGACILPDKVVNYYTARSKFKQNKGHADSGPRIKWTYAQEKRRKKGVKIKITAM